MARMKAMQVASAGGPFELVEREIPGPGRGEVRIKVEACGICHSDLFIKEGLFPGIEYPRVPGHEVVGTVDAVGDGVAGWKVGERIGAGWHGGHCFTCDPCREGDFVLCQNEEITGITRDGGYAQYTIARAEALARVPKELSSIEAAPLLCAGITTYNALRNAGARSGDLVAIQGIGGLGHLGVQYAHSMGFRTVAISGGPEKEKLARELGADVYIDYRSTNVAEELQRLGGARVVLATAPNSKAMTLLIDGLGRNGVMIVVGATADPIEVTPLQLIVQRRSISGWPSGSAKDSEDTLEFSALHEVLPRIETFPLEQAPEAYERMLSNKARFRVVLAMD